MAILIKALGDSSCEFLTMGDKFYDDVSFCMKLFSGKDALTVSPDLFISKSVNK